MQALVVALMVAGCSLYAAWTLMPAAARRAIASTLLKLPLPGPVERKLQRAVTLVSGCGCDGCDHAPAKAVPKSAAPAAQVVTFHPRIHR